MLQVVTNSVAEVLPADRVILYTMDMEKKKVIHFAKGGPGAATVIRYTFQEIMDGLPGWVIRHQEPALAFKNDPDLLLEELLILPESAIGRLRIEGPPICPGGGNHA